MKATMKIEPKKNLMEWIKALDEIRKADWDAKGMTWREYLPLTVTKGSKFVKIKDGGTSWGFICMYDGMFQGFPVKKGDLMKSSGKRPAKHARGNIFDGTAKFSYYGPEYLI
jgi:hypothetical protein